MGSKSSNVMSWIKMGLFWSMVSDSHCKVPLPGTWKVDLVFVISRVTSGLFSLLQRIPLWSLKRRGPVTDLSVPEGSACILCLSISPGSSAVVAWAKPGARTVRNVPSQAQVRHAQPDAHMNRQPYKYIGRLWQLESFLVSDFKFSFYW